VSRTVAILKSRPAGKPLRRRAPELAPNGSLPKGDLLSIYRFMVLMREFEDAVVRLFHPGEFVGGAYSGNGNEATAAASAFALEDGDSIFPMHRDLAAHFVRGQSVLNLMKQYLAREGSLTAGRDGTGHYTDRALGIYGNISHLGAMLPVACGIALAYTIRKERNVVLTYIGDGGSNVGEVHEALAMASAMSLPLVLVVENNGYAYSTPTSKQFVVDRLSSRAAGYGIPGKTVDGTDVLEVYHACREAVARARSMKGPSIIESVTMRMHGHAAHDNAWYVPKKTLDAWKKKDPIARFEKLLAGKGLLNAAAKKKMLAAIRAEIEGAVAESLALPYPGGGDALRGVYAEPEGGE
jgi:TPP-dependent pyruvate/acetoin dehydrogenase alpha subunit